MPPTVTAPEPVHLTKREGAAFLRISVRTLDRLTDIPRVPMQGRIMFRRDTLDAWSKSKEQTPGAVS